MIQSVDAYSVIDYSTLTHECTDEIYSRTIWLICQHYIRKMYRALGSQYRDELDLAISDTLAIFLKPNRDLRKRYTLGYDGGKGVARFSTYLTYCVQREYKRQYARCMKHRDKADRLNDYHEDNYSRCPCEFGLEYAMDYVAEMRYRHGDALVDYALAAVDSEVASEKFSSLPRKALKRAKEAALRSLKETYYD